MKYDKCRHDSLRASAPCGLCPAFMVTDTFRVPHGLMTTGTNLQKPSAIPDHDFHLVPRNFPETFLKPPLKNAPLSHGSSIFKNWTYACRQNRAADNQMRERCQVSIRFPIRPQNRATTQTWGPTSRQKHSGGLAEYPDAIRFRKNKKHFRWQGRGFH